MFPNHPVPFMAGPYYHCTLSVTLYVQLLASGSLSCAVPSASSHPLPSSVTRSPAQDEAVQRSKTQHRQLGRHHAPPSFCQFPFNVSHTTLQNNLSSLDDNKVNNTRHDGKNYGIGTLHYNWPMSAYASQLSFSMPLVPGGDSRLQSDRQRIEAFVSSRAKRRGLCNADRPSATQLVDDADDKLFESVLHNPEHTLQTVATSPT